MTASKEQERTTAMKLPQPFGYVVTTPDGFDIFYRHPVILTIYNDHRSENVYTLSDVLAASRLVDVDNQDTKDALLYRSLKKAHVAKELGVATKEQLQEIELFLLDARYEACSSVGGS